ncbi:hypothetical protein [Mesorhizobium hawassense]|uniref:hypothetical protein n=1 Tax=Mesorhizobium hawassense TaxID=1209954 RepID=UPI000DD3ED0F|nr:hypothetical protein [Mesorhizobium hawassense]
MFGIEGGCAALIYDISHGRSPDRSSTDHQINDVDDNVVRDGSAASGYDYTIEQFKALCPKRVK